MSNQIIRQPDGKFAVFSSVVDGFTLYDATPQEVIDDWVERERNRIAEAVHKICRRLEAGEAPYYQFTLSWEEALKLHHKSFGMLRPASGQPKPESAK